MNLIINGFRDVNFSMQVNNIQGMVCLMGFRTSKQGLIDDFQLDIPLAASIFCEENQPQCISDLDYQYQ